MAEEENMSSVVQVLEDGNGTELKATENDVEKSSKNLNVESESKIQTAREKFICLKRDKRLLLFGLFFICFCVMSALAIYHLKIQFFFNEDNNNNNNSSNTSETVTVENKHGIEIKKKVQIDPCSDFYEFACNHEEIRKADKESEEFFLGLEQRILDNPDPDIQNPDSAEQKAQRFYNSCVKAIAHPESLVNSSAELEQMLDRLDKIPHGHLKDKLTLIQNEYGLDPLFDWGLDQKGVDPYTAKRAEFIRLLEASNDTKTLLSKILGDRLHVTGQPNDFDLLIDLDKTIGKFANESVSMDCYCFDGSIDNFVNVTLLEDVAGFINWKEHFQQKHANMTFQGGVLIIFSCPVYLLELSRKLNQIQNSDGGKQLLGKYLIWQVVKQLFGQILIEANSNSSSGSGSGSGFDQNTNTNKTIPENSGPNSKAINSTTIMCTTLIQKKFAPVLVSLHRRHLLKEFPHLEDRSLKMVQEITENIREELILVLKEVDWLAENKSKDDAIERARKTRAIIGYPQVVKNPKLLDQLYAPYPTMNESDFIGNFINVLKVEKQKMEIDGGATVADGNENSIPFSDLERHVIQNNARALRKFNSIFIPVRNLLPPNFHFPSNPESPDENELSFNYGRVGFTIGHEFSHLFPQYVAVWDKTKTVQYRSLWKSGELREKPEHQPSCLIRQYSKFVHPDQKFLDGTMTLDENFADHGGLVLATRAFFRLLSNKNGSGNSSHEQTPLLMNAKQNEAQNEQSFFLGFATRWCMDEPTKFNPKDYHSPQKFRVLGTLQNSPAFSSIFNCWTIYW